MNSLGHKAARMGCPILADTFLGHRSHEQTGGPIRALAGRSNPEPLYPRHIHLHRKRAPLQYAERGDATMRLVIAEKPSVAADLARVMDPGAQRREGCLEGRAYTWTWALGHLVELAPPEAYQPSLKARWRLELLPVIPDAFRLQPREGRSGQLNVIKRLLAKATETVVATDAGREGEAIWEYIRELCGYTGPAQRLWLSESTPDAVRAAFAALRPPMVHLAAAARARGQADWVVGMNATMALSARHGGLWSAGRVQTPTLALLVAREAEIRAFRPQDYWVVLADSEAQGARYAGRWFREDEDRLPSAAEAEALAAKVRGRTGTVASVERKRAQEAPPRLYNLTDLQRLANSRYGLTAAATLKAAQSLYEEHKVLTYPRTDSRHVSQETASTFPARLRAVSAVGGTLGRIAQRIASNVPDPGRRVIDDARVSDHHALLPTTQAPDLSRLSEDERRVYELVVRRFVAALLPAAVYDDTQAVTEVAGETFRSRSRVLVSAGWREAEPPAAAATPARGKGADRSDQSADGEDEGQGEEEDAGGDLTRLQQGMSSRCVTARAEARQTQPPRRHTEASLLRAMEHAGRLVDDEALADAMRERGLGTPATRASIIETLIKREYVKRERKALVPTERGEQLVTLAPVELRSVETTGEWEARLREIEGGREDAGAFLGGIADLTRRIVQDVSGQERAAPAAGVKDAIGVCPKCGAPVIEGRKGFGCSRWREADGGCKWVLWKVVAGKTLTTAQARELLSTGETKREIKGFRSKAGKSFDARLRLDRETGKVSFLFDPRPTPAGGATRTPGARPSTQKPTAHSTPQRDQRQPRRATTR